MTVKSFMRLNNSRSWNPRYKICLIDMKWIEYDMQTKSDVMFAYWLNLTEWDIYEVNFRRTTKKYIIDWMDRVELSKEDFIDKLNSWIDSDETNKELDKMFSDLVKEEQIKIVKKYLEKDWIYNAIYSHDDSGITNYHTSKLRLFWLTIIVRIIWWLNKNKETLFFNF